MVEVLALPPMTPPVAVAVPPMTLPPPLLLLLPPLLSSLPPPRAFVAVPCCLFLQLFDFFKVVGGGAFY